MDLQVKISISKEAVCEMAEIFREAINRAAVSCQTEAVHQGTVQQPLAVQTATTGSAAPQSVTPYSAQIAQATQQPVQVMTGQTVTNAQPDIQPVAASTQQPIQTQPVAPAQTTVPTASRTYTLDELASAAMQLMDRDMQAQLQDLLAGYGVEALPMLPAEQYGNFATALRGMGVQI